MFDILAAKVEVKTGTPETKTRRQWEQWSTEDKDTFFEGLYEVCSRICTVSGVYVKIETVWNNVTIV